MKQLFSTVVFALLFAMAPSLLADAPKGWGTDYDAALARAAKEKRPVLALFTGSDWCPYCVQLEKKVLKDSSFRLLVPEVRGEERRTALSGLSPQKTARRQAHRAE